MIYKLFILFLVFHEIEMLKKRKIGIYFESVYILRRKNDNDRIKKGRRILFF